MQSTEPPHLFDNQQEKTMNEFGQAPLKAEGQEIAYDYQPRTPEEQIEYYRAQLAGARVYQAKYNHFKRLASRGQLMIASKEGFTLVEDLDEYLAQVSRVPLTRGELIKEGLAQMEQAFDENYHHKWVKP
jgi:hypothetical protein